MKFKSIFVYSLALTLGLSSCVSKKKFKALSAENEQNLKKYSQCDVELAKLKSSLDLRVEQIEDLKKQVEDYKSLRDKQLTQVGDLTVLSQQANKNIDATLAQLEKKDKYIQMLQAAKTKADSINLALAVNLKSALKDGLDDKDIEVNIDKTVVFINLSDKMLYKSGSSELTPRANEVDGVDYNFVTIKKFQELASQDKFLEQAKVFGNYYATLKGPIEDNLAKGIDYLFDIDWQGGQQIGRSALGKDVVSIFILPPSIAELETRLRGRAQDSDEVIAGRMAKSQSEISHWAEYDYVIVNNDIDMAFSDLLTILQAERMRRDRQPGMAEFVRGLNREFDAR